MSPTDPDLLGRAFHRDRNVAELDVGLGGRVLPRLAWRLGGVLLLLALVDVFVAAMLPPDALLRDTEVVVAAYTVKVDRFRTSPAPDVVFLGSSRVQDGVVPARVAEALRAHWGRPARAFNLGLPDARTAEYLALARNHMPEPAPRWVVLCMSGTELLTGGGQGYAERFLWRSGDLADHLFATGRAEVDAQAVESYLESVVSRHWYLYGHRDALRRRLLGAFGLRAPGRAANAATMTPAALAGLRSADGYAPRGEDYSLADALARGAGAVRVPPRELAVPAALVDGSRFEELREVVALLRAHGCRVALAEIPPSPHLQALSPVLHGEGMPATGGRAARSGFRPRMRELAAELGLPFVPCDARASGLDDGDYADVNHLNERGARLYSDHMVRGLIATGFFDA